MNISQLSILSLSLLLFCPSATPFVAEVLTFYKWSQFVKSFIQDSFDLYDAVDGKPIFESAEEKLASSLNNITFLINRIETTVPQVSIARFNQMERDFSKIIHFEIKLDNLVKQIDKIENSFDTFLSLRGKLKTKIENSTEEKAISLKWIMEDFAKSVVTMQGDSVRSSLSAIHDMIDLNDGSSFYSKSDIFTLVLNNFNEKTASRCIIDKSPQQLIFDTLNSLRLIQLKGLAMIEYAFIILKLYTGGDFKEFMEEFHTEMLNRFDKQSEVALNVINQADNSYWKCDPSKHVLNKTYTEITRLLQGHVHNEKELNRKGDCFEGCGFYQYEDGPKCNTDSDKLCRMQPNCEGRVHDCKFVNENMYICFAHDDSPRRYEWIKWAGGPDYGHSERHCMTGASYIEKFRKLLFWKCYYCFCLCDDDSRSDRYFSLLEATSDVENNKVVVGVRFRKEKRFIHLQVKEAKLLRMGMIDNTTASWVSLPELSINNWKDKSKYHKLTYESRSFDLDDMMAPVNYLVTGVRFRQIGSHLNIEVRFTAFDFNNGTLFNNLTWWKGNDNTDATENSPRQEKDLGQNNDLPIDFLNQNHVPDSEPNTFIRFQPSNEYSDAAQSTVPFIDIQPVTPKPPIPLVGLGILHKGIFTSGGFIEPKVFTLNVANYSLGKVDNVIDKYSENVDNE